MARAAIDAALYDAIGKATNQPVYNLIGGLAQPRIPLEELRQRADVTDRVDGRLSEREFSSRVREGVPAPR